MLKDIVSAEYISDYKIKIKFEDGLIGIVDFAKEFDKKGVFKQLEDLEYFRKFYVNEDLGAICWPNGQDIAPEAIYEKIAA